MPQPEWEHPGAFAEGTCRCRDHLQPKSRLRSDSGSSIRRTRSVISRRILLPTATFALTLVVRAADFPAPYNSETTPGAPMPAEEAAAKWKVPPGFKVTVFAAEPDVQNPIACAWDPRGRLWIAENYTYAEHAVKWEAKLRDRVLIFEDTDNDGCHDKRTVFTDDVQHLTSVEVGLGGVWVMCPPQVLFIPDRNHDDVPDGPAEVVLDGFTVPPENYHNFANGLRWGPDGWLYGRCGGSAPGLIGTPGTPNEQRVPIAGGIWRYHPQRKVFEALCHGTTNPWGSDWNEDGEMFFTNTVNGHLWHMIPGAHYTRPHTIDPNPNVYQLIDQHADHYHFDTGKGWQASRDGANGADALGGGHAHCGAMIYLADNWPKEYRGKLMTLNFHGRRINVERLERQGSGYVGKHEPDICFSADPFFRGIDLTYGPDGGVFVLDWSDTGECHESTGVHRTSGRIYKITYGDPKKPAVQDLTKLNNDELVKLHEHENEWFARMARRELAERDSAHTLGKRISDSLRLILASNRDANSRRRSLCSLHVLNNVDAKLLESLVHDSNETIRALAVRLFVDSCPLDLVTGHRHPKADDISVHNRDIFDQMALAEDSALVRLTIASALNRISFPSRILPITRLAYRAEDVNDHNIPNILWYSLESTFQYAPTAFVDITVASRIPLIRRCGARLIASESEKDPALLERLLKARQRLLPSALRDVLIGLGEGFTGWRKAPKPASWDAFAAMVIESGNPELITKVRELNVLFGDGRALDDVKRLALDDKAELESRKAALRSLIDARPDYLRAVCEKLLNVRFLNTVAVRGLALSHDPAVGAKLARSYKTFHPSERPAVVETLVSRASFAKALLEEVAAGRISREDISAYHARQIRNLGEAELTAQLGKVWGEVREGSEDKRALIAKWKTALSAEALAKADKSAGRAVFNQVCTTCHLLYGQGGQIGPDLTGSGRNNLDYLLENILDPGAVVNADFRLNVVTLKDGRVLNGMVSAKTDRTLTLKTMTEPVTVERSEIAKQEELPQSLMPEGLLQTFTQEQVRDLIAYLMHPSQVPLPQAK
jgi:putative membrane-bound dehydrogenase-like protein